MANNYNYKENRRNKSGSSLLTFVANAAALSTLFNKKLRTDILNLFSKNNPFIAPRTVSQNQAQQTQKTIGKTALTYNEASYIEDIEGLNRVLDENLKSTESLKRYNEKKTLFENYHKSIKEIISNRNKNFNFFKPKLDKSYIDFNKFTTIQNDVIKVFSLDTIARKYNQYFRDEINLFRQVKKNNTFYRFDPRELSEKIHYNKYLQYKFRKLNDNYLLYIRSFYSDKNFSTTEKGKELEKLLKEESQELLETLSVTKDIQEYEFKNGHFNNLSQQEIKHLENSFSLVTDNETREALKSIQQNTKAQYIELLNDKTSFHDKISILKQQGIIDKRIVIDDSHRITLLNYFKNLDVNNFNSLDWQTIEQKITNVKNTLENTGKNEVSIKLVKHNQRVKVIFDIQVKLKDTQKANLTPEELKHITCGKYQVEVYLPYKNTITPDYTKEGVVVDMSSFDKQLNTIINEAENNAKDLTLYAPNTTLKYKEQQLKQKAERIKSNFNQGIRKLGVTATSEYNRIFELTEHSFDISKEMLSGETYKKEIHEAYKNIINPLFNNIGSDGKPLAQQNYNKKIVNIDTEFDAENGILKEITFIVTDENNNKQVKTYINEKYKPTVFDKLSETNISAKDIKNKFHDGQVETCIDEKDLYNKINKFIKDNDISNSKIIAKSPYIIKNGKETSDIGILKEGLKRYANEFPETNKLIDGTILWIDTQKIADIMPGYDVVYHRNRSENMPRFLKDLYALSKYDATLRNKMDTVITKLDNAYSAANKNRTPIRSIIQQSSNSHNLHLSRTDTLLNDCFVEFIKILSEENIDTGIKYSEKALLNRLGNAPFYAANLVLNGYLTQNSQEIAAHKFPTIPVNMIVPFGTTNIGVTDKLYQYRQTLQLVDMPYQLARKKFYKPSIYSKALFNSVTRKLTDNYELAADVSLIFGAQTEQLFQEGAAVINGHGGLNDIHFASDIEETVHVDKLDSNLDPNTAKDKIIENNAQLGHNVTYDNKGNVFGSKNVLNITGNKILITQIIPSDKGGYDIRYRKVSNISANVKLNSLGSGMSVATFRDDLYTMGSRKIDLSIGANTYLKKGSSVQMLNMLLGSVSQHIEESGSIISIKTVKTALQTSQLSKYVDAKEDNGKIIFVVDNEKISNDISLKDVNKASNSVNNIVERVKKFSKSIGLNQLTDHDIRNSIFFTSNVVKKSNITTLQIWNNYRTLQGKQLKKFYFKELTSAITFSLMNQNKLSEEGLNFLSITTGIDKKVLRSFDRTKNIDRWNRKIEKSLWNADKNGELIGKMFGLRYDGTASEVSPILTFHSRMSFRVISNLATNIANTNSFKIDKVFTTLLGMQPGGKSLSKYFEDIIKQKKDVTYTYPLQKKAFLGGTNAFKDKSNLISLETILNESLEALKYTTDEAKYNFLKDEVLKAIETQENGTFAIKSKTPYEEDTLVDIKLVKNDQDAYVQLQKEIHERARGKILYYKTADGKTYTYYADQIIGSYIEGEKGKYLTTEFYRHLMKNVMNIKGIKKYSNEELENEFFNTILNKYTRNLVKAEVPSVAGTVDFGKPITRDGSGKYEFDYLRSLYYNEAIVSKKQFYKVKKKIEETSIEEINYAIKYMQNFEGEEHARLSYMKYLDKNGKKGNSIYAKSIEKFNTIYENVTQKKVSGNAFLYFLNNSNLTDAQKKELYISAVEEGLLPIFSVGVKYPVSQYDVVTGQATFFMNLHESDRTTLLSQDGYSKNTTLLHPFLMKLAKVDKDTDTYMLALASGSGQAVEEYFSKYYSTNERYNIATDATLFKTDNVNFQNKYLVLEKSFYGGQALLVNPRNPRDTILKKLTPTEVSLNKTFGLSYRQKDSIQAMIKNYTIKTKAPDVYEVMASNLFMNEEVYKLSPEAQRYFQTKIGPIMELPLNVRNKFSKENVFEFLDYLRGHSKNAKDFMDNLNKSDANTNVEIKKYFDPLINDTSSTEEIKYVNELINVINKREQNNPKFTPLTTKSIRAVDIMRYNLNQEEWKEIHKTIRNLPYREVLNNAYEKIEHVGDFINNLQSIAEKSVNHFKNMSNKKKALFGALGTLGIGLGALILSEPDLGYIPGTGRESVFSWSTDERQYEEMMNSPLNQGKVRLMRYNYNEKIRPNVQISRNLYTPIVNQI